MGMKITVSDINSVRKEVTVVYFFLNLNTASGKTSQFNSPTTRCMQRLLFCALKNSRFSSRLRKLLLRLTLINLFNWKLKKNSDPDNKIKNLPSNSLQVHFYLLKLFISQNFTAVFSRVLISAFQNS